MAYRPEWFPKENILDMARDIVMYVRGSYETLTEDHELSVKALKWVVKNWDFSYSCKIEEDKEFDDSVLKVINVALKMERNSRKREES